MSLNIETRCIHIENAAPNPYGAISYPIFQTATFAHPGFGQSTGYDYSRQQNPTREHLEQMVSTLENGVDAIACSSGMSAIAMMMELFQPGDHLIIEEDLYGGSIRLFDHISKKNHLSFSALDLSSEDPMPCFNEHTKAVFIETPTNPMLAPFDSWLLLRRIQTLSVRMKAAGENAARIARWLTEQKYVKKVYYPGLPDHPGHAIMKKQARGFGAMVSFTVESGKMARNILEKIRLIQYAESLGGTETLLTYPLTQTHADVPETLRQKNGITDCLLRLSAGIENADDLISDLDQAFQAAAADTQI